MSVFWNIVSTEALDSGDSDFYAAAANLEALLERPFAGISQSYAADADTQPSDEIESAWENGRTFIYQNASPTAVFDPATVQTGAFWASVANGTYDGVLASYLNAIMSDARWTSDQPFYWSFQHAQSLTLECPGGTAAGTPADHAAALQHVYALMIQVGAHVSVGGNMLLCFIPTWEQLYNDPAYSDGRIDRTSPHYAYRVSQIDPGAASYDVVGVEAFKPRSLISTFRMEDILNPVHRWALARGLPFMIAELGIHRSSDAQILRDLAALDTLLQSWGQGQNSLFALAWRSRIEATGDYRIDASASALAAYKELANDPYYERDVD